jgi:hypothetical protein
MVDQNKIVMVYLEQYTYEDNNHYSSPINFHFHNYVYMKLPIIDKEDNYVVVVYLMKDKPI